MLFKFLKRYARKKQWVFEEDNVYGLFSLSSKEKEHFEKLELENVRIWVVDTNLKILHGTDDPENNIYIEDYIGKYKDKCGPQGIFKLGASLLRECQDGKSRQVNAIINGKYVFLNSVPIMHMETIVGSALYVIPYKV